MLGYGTRDKDTDTRDWTLVRSDGVKLPVSLAITAIRAADGTLTGYLGIGRDITAERQAARELRDAEERFRNAFDQAPIGKALVVARRSLHARQRGARPASSATVRAGAARASRSSRSRTPTTSTSTSSNMHRLIARESESYELRKRYRHADGHYIWALLSVSLVRDEGGAPHYFVAQIQDISEQVLTDERLTEQTLHDPLTGLANRVLFADRLAHAVERSRRSKERIAVLFIDFDRFKSVNDSLGHAAGDELLRQAGERMRRAVRPADTIARLGGDEFTVLCEDLGAVNDAGLGRRSAQRHARAPVRSLRQPRWHRRQHRHRRRRRARQRRDGAREGRRRDVPREERQARVARRRLRRSGTELERGPFWR